MVKFEKITKLIVMYRLGLCFLVLFTSCSQENRSVHKKEMIKERISEKESISSDNPVFEKIIGVWKIDSTKQDEKSVFISDTFQGFVFKKNGVFATTEKYGNAIAEREIGNYSMNDDNLVIYSQSGNQLMRYSIVKISDKELNLFGGPSGKNPIQFFLSKFKEAK
jgi:hypothetical protein